MIVYSRMNKLTGRLFAEGDGTPAPVSPPPAPAPSGEGKKTFTQEEVNAFLADDRRKHQANVATLQQEVAKFQGTAKEKEALQVKLQEMEKQFLTKEQLQAQEQEKAKKQYETALETTQAERDQWKNVFVNNLAEVEIAKAAAQNQAFNPGQLSLLLKNQVKVKQKTDSEGRPTMDFEVLMPVQSKDKDGKATVLELPVGEGVKKMREDPGFANLFLIDATGGTGKTTINNTNTPVGPGGPPEDPAEYRAWRARQQKSGR
jgi:hypothetical protein